MSAPLDAVLDAQGARFREAGGVRMARDFGDTRAEYEAIRGGCGIAWRADRRLIEMHGRDPVRMLHGLITNDLAAASPERAVYAALLTPKGRVITDLRAVPGPSEEEGRLLVEIGASAAEAAGAHLRKFVPPMFAKWEFSEQVVLGVYGRDAAACLARAGIELPELEEDGARRIALGDSEAVAVGTRYTGTPGIDLWLAEEAAAELWPRLVEADAAPAGHAAIETLRVEAGRPRPGPELSEEIIATEAFEGAGLMERAVSFSKGCYTGQEVIVRIAHRGKVNRLLRGLFLGEQRTPEVGTPLLHPETEKEVGWVTTAAVSPRFGQTIALAFVRREREPGSHVLVGGESAEVVALPFPEA